MFNYQTFDRIIELLGFAVVVLMLHFIIRLRSRLKLKHLPPSPPGLPFIGNISVFLFSSGTSPWLVFKDLATRYGDVFGLNIAGKRFLVLSSPNAIREAFVRKSNQFSGRPFVYSISLISKGNCGIAFGDFSPAWKFHRKNAASALRQHLKPGSCNWSFIGNAESAIQREITDWIVHATSKSGQGISIGENFTTPLVNIICNMTFSKRYQKDDPELASFTDANSKLKELMSPGHPLDLLPLLRHLPFRRLRTIQEIVSIQDEIVRREYLQHLATFDPDNIRDLTDTFIQVMRDMNESHNPQDKFMVTENHVIMWMWEVFSGGFESSLQTLRWAVAYLLHNPEVQKKAQTVLDNNVNGRLPCWRDRRRLAYIEAIVLETLRHSSLSSLNAPHKTTCDTSVGGYDVAKDTTVITNLWWVHHDPALWDQPFCFKPERFLADDGKCKVPNHFMPFSVGGRECIGKKLAVMQLFLFLAGLLQNFTVSAPSNGKLPELAPTLSMSIRTIPEYIVVMEKRE